jgi:hypothetical protein
MANKSLTFLKNSNTDFDNVLDSKFNHISDASTFAQVADTTHNNTTDAANVATLTIPAGRLNAGSIIHLQSAGFVLDNNSTDTLTPVLNLVHGATTVALATGAALDVADNDILRVDSWIQVRTIGTAGTFVSCTKLNTDANGGTNLDAVVTSTAVDTTVAINLNLNVDWSVANADNEYTHLIHTCQIFG